MKTLLVSVDFSRSTRAVVETAVGLAAAPGSRIILHHCHNPPVVTADYGLGLELINQVHATGEKAARHQLEHLEDELTAQGFDVTSAFTDGLPATRILELAAKRKADLIVLGSHGHTALYELLLGGTTHLVLKKACCPVLVVPSACPAPSRKKR